MGRFINADDVSLLGINNTFNAFNLFAYCLNNPVRYLDIDGDFAIATLILIGSIIIGGGAAVYHGYNMRQAGASWKDTILESLTFGLGVGCTVYTWGMSAYALYYDYCMYRGYVPRTHIGSPERELQKAAETANSSVDGNGHVAGTKKHKVFSDTVKSYKNERIVTEASYKGGDYVSCGTKGSIRFDVVQYNRYGEVIKAWDFKTGSAYLSQSRISAMIRRSGLDIPIHMIK